MIWLIITFVCKYNDFLFNAEKYEQQKHPDMRRMGSNGLITVINVIWKYISRRPKNILRTMLFA